MESFQILLFYKYVFINDPEVVKDWLTSLCKSLELKGRLIVGKEGLNITLEGKTDNTEVFIKELEMDSAGSPQASRFLDIHYKRSVGTGQVFPKLSVKVRDEIVSAHLGTCDINPNEVTGIHLKPEELHQWINPPAGGGKEFYIIDMRNAYEHAVGRFAGSICPPMDNFRDLPKIIKSISHLKNKTVLTVCTGGVRCEKASGYLLSQGFTDVYQLDGGIVSYMEMYPNEDFEGKLYVFDGRVVMGPPRVAGGPLGEAGFYTDDPRHVIVGKCESCGDSSENIVDCRSGSCNGQFIICQTCEKSQIEKKGITHCPKGCNGKVKSPFHKIFKKVKNIFK